MSFGGLTARIVKKEDEEVSRRGWPERDHLLDLVGGTSLIPGPNFTEMAIDIGSIYGVCQG